MRWLPLPLVPPPRRRFCFGGKQKQSLWRWYGTRTFSSSFLPRNLWFYSTREHSVFVLRPLPFHSSAEMPRILNALNSWQYSWPCPQVFVTLLDETRFLRRKTDRSGPKDGFMLDCHGGAFVVVTYHSDNDTPLCPTISLLTKLRHNTISNGFMDDCKTDRWTQGGIEGSF